MALPGWPFAPQWDQPVAESGEPCNPRAGAEVHFATSTGKGLFWPDNPPRHSAWRKDLMCSVLCPRPGPTNSRGVHFGITHRLRPTREWKWSKHHNSQFTPVATSKSSFFLFLFSSSWCSIGAIPSYLLTSTELWREATARMSAQDTVWGHAASTAALMVSTTSNPRKESMLGREYFSESKVDELSSKSDPSHPCSDACIVPLWQPQKLNTSLRTRSSLYLAKLQAFVIQMCWNHELAFLRLVCKQSVTYQSDTGQGRRSICTS